MILANKKLVNNLFAKNKWFVFQTGFQAARREDLGKCSANCQKLGGLSLHYLDDNHDDYDKNDDDYDDNDNDYDDNYYYNYYNDNDYYDDDNEFFTRLSCSL